MKLEALDGLIMMESLSAMKLEALGGPIIQSWRNPILACTLKVTPQKYVKYNPTW